MKIGDEVKFRLDKNTCVIGRIADIEEVGRTDRVINYKVTLRSASGHIYPKKFQISKPISKKPKTEKAVKPYTRQQVHKLCAQIRADLKQEHSDHFEDACCDAADGIIQTDPRMIEYLRQNQVPRDMWKECLADRIFG